MSHDFSSFENLIADCFCGKFSRNEWQSKRAVKLGESKNGLGPHDIFLVFCGYQQSITHIRSVKLELRQQECRPITICHILIAHELFKANKVGIREVASNEWCF